MLDRYIVSSHKISVSDAAWPLLRKGVVQARADCDRHPELKGITDGLHAIWHERNECAINDLKWHWTLPGQNVFYMAVGFKTLKKAGHGRVL